MSRKCTGGTGGRKKRAVSGISKVAESERNNKKLQNIRNNLQSKLKEVEAKNKRAGTGIEQRVAGSGKFGHALPLPNPLPHLYQQT